MDSTRGAWSNIYRTDSSRFTGDELIQIETRLANRLPSESDVAYTIRGEVDDQDQVIFDWRLDVQSIETVPADTSPFDIGRFAETRLEDDLVANPTSFVPERALIGEGDSAVFTREVSIRVEAPGFEGSFLVRTGILAYAGLDSQQVATFRYLESKAAFNGLPNNSACNSARLSHSWTVMR